jgi:hypothetical protein
MKEPSKRLKTPVPAPDRGENPLIKAGPARKSPDYTLGILKLVILAAVLALSIILFPFAGSPWTAPDKLGVHGGIFLAALVLVLSIRKVNEWDRAIILRFGRFRRVQGPGLFLLIPLADRVAETVDIRIRVTDFSAQETLTLDSVTVTVDALCFWLVWDPQKAILELENYQEAVILASKTALRDSVSSHDLSTFLERGDLIEKQIREEVDRKTTEWGSRCSTSRSRTSRSPKSCNIPFPALPRLNGKRRAGCFWRRRKSKSPGGWRRRCRSTPRPNRP